MARVDVMLKEFYDSRKTIEEAKVFEKAKDNKNVLFKYIKKMNKSKNTIGPLKVNGKVSTDPVAVTLTKQYESVFSKPIEEFIIDNDKFFNAECEDCAKEKTHVCQEDVKMFKPKNYRYSLSDIYFTTENMEVVT